MVLGILNSVFQNCEIKIEIWQIQNVTLVKKKNSKNRQNMRKYERETFNVYTYFESGIIKYSFYFPKYWTV